MSDIPETPRTSQETPRGGGHPEVQSSAAVNDPKSHSPPTPRTPFISLLSHVQEQLPELNIHFRSQSFLTSMYASSWFLTLFLTTFPLPVATRVFDIFMYEVRRLQRAPEVTQRPRPPFPCRKHLPLAACLLSFFGGGGRNPKIKVVVGGKGGDADPFLQGLEIVFRVGMALLQFNQAELVQLDMEGMSQVRLGWI